MKMDEAFNNGTGNPDGNMTTDDAGDSLKAVHARDLEKAVERILRNVMGDTADSAKFAPSDTMEGVKFHAEEDIKELIAAHSRFEHFFSKIRLVYSHQHPEKVLEAKLKEMRKALQRKETLINRHHQNLSKWHSILQDGVPVAPPPAEPSSDPVPPVQPAARPNVPDVVAARSTPAPPRQSPGAVPDNVRAPSTPSVAVLSPAASITSQPPAVNYQPPPPAPSPYPHPSTPAAFSQQPGPAGQQAMYQQQRQPFPQQQQQQQQQQARAQGVPTPPYPGMNRPSNPGYSYQPQQPGGYGLPRPGVSPLSAMLQAGPTNPAMQQQMRVPSPNASQAGVYGQNVSPRMPGQWRPNMAQMGQQPGQMPQGGYSGEDGTYGQPPQMHPGQPGPQ